MANDDFQQSRSEEDSDSDDSDIAFASVDFSGVNFDGVEKDGQDPVVSDVKLTTEEEVALGWDRANVFGNLFSLESEGEALTRLCDLGQHIASGKYAEALQGEVAQDFFRDIVDEVTVVSSIRRQVIAKGTSILSCLEIEMLGIAALNLFLQGNYTGPALEETDEVTFSSINPHSCFSGSLCAADQSADDGKEEEEEKKESLTASKRNTKYQNAVLSELAVGGEWPCQVCNVPYFLLLARSIFSTLSDPLRSTWSHLDSANDWRGESAIASEAFLHNASKLTAAPLWSARAVVAHERLLQGKEPSIELWGEVDAAFVKSVDIFCPEINDSKPNPDAATVMLERGLAEHHFDRPGSGKESFTTAKQYSALTVEVTGAEGKRTKFQQQAFAQMVVRAQSAAIDGAEIKEEVRNEKQSDIIKGQMIEHSEEEILLERVKFTEKEENEVKHLTVLDQTILLALCLDVKNSNPDDGLSGEEMKAFLARVLDHHDDWMVYSTALLERSWLEFEQNHGRERAILQMQALVDQHTNRLTITQSTRQSVDDSAPPQDRLRYLHSIVYPPRWSMIADLANRYASMGIVTSAAELYTDVEFWDEVVECYRRAGKVSKAEQIVRERLATEETPRMWAALGDLTNDPSYYERAVELSKGRFSTAYIALGQYYFDKGQMETAVLNYEKALKSRPLSPGIWFKVGSISMKLGRWEKALQAFSKVVQQEPEEGDAWANVAAVHMHNKHPAEAYPALTESLKYNRNNWRVWVSKLYTCLDLQKIDEAIQACNVILDLTDEKPASARGPVLEEKCIRAIVAGALLNFRENRSDAVAQDSSRRTLTRVQGLLERISATSQAKPWIFELIAAFYDQIGNNEKVLENLMKEYRLLQTSQGWERDDFQVVKICGLVSYAAQLHVRDGSRESLNKARFLLRGVVQKVRLARELDPKIPDEVIRAEKMLQEIDTLLQKLTIDQVVAH
jgi:tetratricopeptide (TPR) repeat protein